MRSVVLKRIFPVLMLQGVLFAQDPGVHNVRFTERGDTVEVMYDLSGMPNRRYEVTVLLSYDSGRTFPWTLRHVSGEAGRGIRPGRDLRIIWELKKEFPGGLVGEQFVFAVEAQPQKRDLRLPMVALGAGAFGGMVYFLASRRPAASGPQGGKIIIRVPAEF